MIWKIFGKDIFERIADKEVLEGVGRAADSDMIVMMILSQMLVMIRAD